MSERLSIGREAFVSLSSMLIDFFRASRRIFQSAS